MRVEDIMMRDIFTCDTRANLDGVARVMWEHDCGYVPIVNGSHTLMGVLTDRDIAMAAYTRGKRLADISVTDVMSRHLNACEIGVSVEHAHQIMRNAKIRRLPVVDADGRLVGLVAWSDLLAAAQKEADGRAAEIMTSAVIETVDMTSAHHR